MASHHVLGSAKSLPLPCLKTVSLLDAAINIPILYMTLGYGCVIDYV